MSDEERVESLRVASLTDERLKLNNSIADICRSIEENATEVGHLDPAGRKILNDRLLFLRAKDPRTHDDVLELFDVALLLQDYATARTVITGRDLSLLDEANPGDAISLAEQTYFEDAPNAAKAYLTRIQPKLSHAPTAWQVRFIVLDAVLNGDTESCTRELSSVLEIDSDEARKRLRKCSD